ncbi:hypothetical protein CRUP_012230 [Coryphaenoides rupestris]|nr:hypothetical protein CRUP_012230 [Coryphaenoides rupestris]
MQSPFSLPSALPKNFRLFRLDLFSNASKLALVSSISFLVAAGYMWINKPNKLLSPEYLWQDFKPKTPELKIVRFSGVVKNYREIRPNK